MLELKTREDAAKILLDAGWKLEQVTDVLRGPVRAIAPLHGQPVPARLGQYVSSDAPSGLAREIGRMIVGGEFEARQFVSAALNADICPQCGSTGSMHCPQSNCPKLVD